MKHSPPFNPILLETTFMIYHGEFDIRGALPIATQTFLLDGLEDATYIVSSNEIIKSLKEERRKDEEDISTL